MTRESRRGLNELPSVHRGAAGGSDLLPVLWRTAKRDRPASARRRESRQEGRRRGWRGAGSCGERAPTHVRQGRELHPAGGRGSREDGQAARRQDGPGGEGRRERRPTRGGDDGIGRAPRQGEGTGPLARAMWARPPGESIQTVFYATRPSMAVRQRGTSLVEALLLAYVLAVILSPASVAATTPRVLATPAGAIVVNFNVPVDAGSADYVQHAAQLAIDDRADLIIVMNTPGGLLANMVQIVGSIQTVQDAGLA